MNALILRIVLILRKFPMIQQNSKNKKILRIRMLVNTSPGLQPTINLYMFECSTNWANTLLAFFIYIYLFTLFVHNPGRVRVANPLLLIGYRFIRILIKHLSVILIDWKRFLIHLKFISTLIFDQNGNKRFECRLVDFNTFKIFPHCILKVKFEYNVQTYCL